MKRKYFFDLPVRRIKKDCSEKPDPPVGGERPNVFLNDRLLLFLAFSH